MTCDGLPCIFQAAVRMPNGVVPRNGPSPPQRLVNRREPNSQKPAGGSTPQHHASAPPSPVSGGAETRPAALRVIRRPLSSSPYPSGFSKVGVL